MKESMHYGLLTGDWDVQSFYNMPKTLVKIGFEK
jgi:hypothetical protein